MCVIWQPESFSFPEFEDWEDWATEDENVAESVGAGTVVPINVGGDGVFQIVVRWGEGGDLTDRERAFVLVSSEPYLLVSEGSFALGGLEDVGDAEPKAENFVSLAKGRYAVQVHLVDWKADPGSVDSNGKPGPDALPDFVVLIGDEVAGPYRTSVQTFNR